MYIIINVRAFKTFVKTHSVMNLSWPQYDQSENGDLDFFIESGNEGLDVDTGRYMDTMGDNVDELNSMYTFPDEPEGLKTLSLIREEVSLDIQRLGGYIGRLSLQSLDPPVKTHLISSSRSYLELFLEYLDQTYFPLRFWEKPYSPYTLSRVHSITNPLLTHINPYNTTNGTSPANNYPKYNEWPNPEQQQGGQFGQSEQQNNPNNTAFNNSNSPYYTQQQFFSTSNETTNLIPAVNTDPSKQSVPSTTKTTPSKIFSYPTTDPSSLSSSSPAPSGITTTTVGQRANSSSPMSTLEDSVDSSDDNNSEDSKSKGKSRSFVIKNEGGSNNSSSSTGTKKTQWKFHVEKGEKKGDKRDPSGLKFTVVTPALLNKNNTTFVKDESKRAYISKTDSTNPNTNSTTNSNSSNSIPQPSYSPASAAKPSAAAVSPSHTTFNIPNGLNDLEIFGVLSIGAFSRTYLCRCKTNNVLYSLKILHRSTVYKCKQIQHIQNEKSNLLQLQHPGIVKLYKTFSNRQSLYLLLEFVPGGELFTQIRKFGRLDSYTAKFYAAQVILVLEYMHNQGIAFRDIKPENILISETGHIKLTEFGFSKLISDRSWTVCGTPDYIAPEVISGEGHTKAVDWWSLGVLIYEMLAGYPPFTASNSLELFTRIREPHRISFPPEIDANAKDLVLRLLVVDPSLRLGSKGNGIADLKQHGWWFSEPPIDWNTMSTSWESSSSMASPFYGPIIPSFSSPLENYQHSVDNSRANPDTGPDDSFPIPSNIQSFFDSF